uniref:Uncharacterized protein n=1 Tax=Romanomermis culicivorax TaxID=13658 RepID=A0A915KEM3_ROMCU
MSFPPSKSNQQNGNAYQSRGRYGSRGGGPPRVYNGGPRRPRDLDGELLTCIMGEFQVFCCETRPFADILQRVQDRRELFEYLYKKPENLRLFIESYKEFFYFDPPNSDTVRWSKERPISRRDPKEPLRQEKRRHDKEFEIKVFKYDVVLEEEILSFVTSLFVIVNERWLSTEVVEKAVKQAFSNDVDLLDYFGSSIRNFLVRRGHLFMEQTEALFFWGISQYKAVFKISCWIRNNPQGRYREGVKRLHELWLADREITTKMRKDLLIDGRADFVHFIRRMTFVFKLEDNDAYVSCENPLPDLTFDPRDIRSPIMVETLLAFKELYLSKHPQSCQNNAQSSIACVFDPDGNVQELGRQIDVQSSIDDGTSTSSRSRRGQSILNENPFQKRQLEAAQSSLASLSLTNAAIGNRNSSSRPVREPNLFLRTPGQN